MKNIIVITIICGMTQLAFSQNFGIGTSSPAAKLHVAGGGTIIGTTGSGSVNRTLTVLGNNTSQINFGSYPYDWSPAIQIQNNDNTKFTWISAGGSGNYSGHNARYYTSGSGLDFYTGSNSFAATIGSNGYVGIGTSSPTQKLHVYYGNAMIQTDLGYLGLTGDLPGYATNHYPTLKSTYSYMYISVAGYYSAYITSGGSFYAVSSRNKKENLEELNKQDILHKIGQLEMYKWNYISEDDGVKHIGPIAEDFYDKFQLGANDSMISHIDPAGVALVGIQALSDNQDKISKQLNVLSEKIAALEDENARLKEQLLKK